MSSCSVESMGTFDPLQLPEGALTTGWLAAVPVGLDAPLRMPLMAARGPRPGPTALLVAGVHGDEFEGIVALSRLMTSLGIEAMAGTVITLPVCNPFAFEAQSRATPAHIDGAESGQGVPRRRSGTPTSRLASALFTWQPGCWGKTTSWSTSGAEDGVQVPGTCRFSGHRLPRASLI